MDTHYKNMQGYTDPVTGLPAWKTQPKSVAGTLISVEDAVRAGFRAIIKRAVRMRAIDAGLSGMCSDMRDVNEYELIAWVMRERNREAVIRSANRWVEIGRIELRSAHTHKLQEVQEKMRLKTQQAEQVFNLFK